MIYTSMQKAIIEQQSGGNNSPLEKKYILNSQITKKELISSQSIAQTSTNVKNGSCLAVPFDSINTNDNKWVFFIRRYVIRFINNNGHINRIAIKGCW